MCDDYWFCVGCMGVGVIGFIGYCDVGCVVWVVGVWVVGYVCYDVFYVVYYYWFGLFLWIDCVGVLVGLCVGGVVIVDGSMWYCGVV